MLLDKPTCWSATIMWVEEQEMIHIANCYDKSNITLSIIDK